MKQLPAVPKTDGYGTHLTGNSPIACASTADVCAVGLSDFSEGERCLVRVYRTDGTELLTVPTRTCVGSLALSSISLSFRREVALLSSDRHVITRLQRFVDEAAAGDA